MKITDIIARVFGRHSNVLRQSSVVLNDIYEPTQPFGDVVFLNIVELLTDLASEVTWVQNGSNDTLKFAEFVQFYNRYGKQILTKLYYKGFAVIGYKTGFRWLSENEYVQVNIGDTTEIRAKEEGVQVYVMKSQIYDLYGKSDHCFLSPFLVYLDNVLNASNTVSARLGNVVIGSPKNLTSAPTSIVLTKQQKDDIEKELQEDYGALYRQRQIMILPREMSFQVINLAGLDQRTTEKVRTAILAIADRVKVPANQIAIIDANSSKSLSNGSELREGDYSKYQSFERLLNSTFLLMAESVGLKITYIMDNKPKRE